jgi:hypothetical protein
MLRLVVDDLENCRELCAEAELVAKNKKGDLFPAGDDETNRME